jgi:hypothetical protein
MLPEFDKLSKRRQKIMLDAVTNRLNWYEDAINSKAEFVMVPPCRVCETANSVTEDMWEILACDVCPFHVTQHRDCITSARHQISVNRVSKYSYDYDGCQFCIHRSYFRFLKRRFKELLKRLERNGFQYK